MHPSAAELLALAWNHHQAGRFSEAEPVYRQVLALDPHNVDAWHLLGVLAYQAGAYEIAIPHLEEALRLKPDYAEGLYNLANAYFLVGRIEEAIGGYVRATQLRPDYFEAYNNLGNAYVKQGRLAAAQACYGRVLELKPEHASAHFNLGNTLKDQGQLNEAIGCYRRAVECDPSLAEAYYCLGVALDQRGSCDEAVQAYERAIQLRAGYAEAWNDLGNVSKEVGKLDKAIECYRRALAERPGDFKFHSNLATALWDQGKLDEAEASFGRALELNPHSAEVHWNRSLVRLLCGDFQNGWAEYEWRWQTGQLTAKQFPQPRWQGEPLAGRTILLWCEQGFGDTFQFIRYAAVVKNLGARVIVECQPALVRVLSSCPGIDALFAQGDPVPDFDVHLPLLSVPGVVGTDIRSIPAQVPYLFAEPELSAAWLARLTEAAGFRIGIHWRGREGRGPFQRRNIPLDCFTPLAALPGVRLVSLQKGPGRQELAAWQGRVPIVDLGEELDALQGAFVDTVAILANVDLVITSDTSIAHLAGALGVRVWVALPFMPDWRWLLDRDDSPWYPTMRLFRQRRAGDWAGVTEAIAAELKGLVEMRREGGPSG